MLNISVKRMKIAGRIVSRQELLIDKKYVYRVAIRKFDGSVWRVNISEEDYMRIFKEKAAIFELAMVFENDDIFGKVNTELSRIEQIYRLGIEITEDEYNEQLEIDKTWLTKKKDIEQINRNYKKGCIVFGLTIVLIIIMAFGLYFLL